MTQELPKYRDLIPYESDEELYFLMWAFELKEAGYIKTIERSPSFDLTAGLYNDYTEAKQLKTKVRVIEKRQVLLNPSSYTPEFVINWYRHANDKFIYTLPAGGSKVTEPLIAQWISGEYEHPESFLTYIECKPDFDQNNMTRLFKNNQKFMWEKHRIFVNLVKTKEFFEKTFTPREFLVTKTGKERKINFPVRTLAEYLKENE